MRVVIVEDHILFRDGLVSLLGSQPDIEIVGESGCVSDAVSVTLREKPDLLLLDLGLPDGDGLEIIKSVLSILPRTRIVVLTIHDSDDMLYAAIRLGARGYVLKTTPVAKLLAALRSLERGEIALSRRMMARILEEFTRQGALPGAIQPALKTLTDRELEVLELLSTGASNREIGERLSITENTVKAHIHAILDKLSLPNRTEAASFARRHGVIDPLNTSSIP